MEIIANYNNYSVYFSIISNKLDKREIKLLSESNFGEIISTKCFIAINPTNTEKLIILILDIPI